jgi:integrase
MTERTGRIALTRRIIDAAKYEGDGASRHVLWDAEVRGLGLRVLPSGRKVFVLRYRPATSRTKRLMTLGEYGALTVPAARKLAEKHKGDVAKGKDPLETKQEALRGDLMKDLAEAFITREVKHKKSAAEMERRIRKHIIPKLGRKRCKDVSTADCSKLHYAIGDTAPEEANAVRTVLHRVFEMGRKWGYTVAGRANPVAEVEPFAHHPRDRFADAEELPALWRAIEAEDDEHIRAVFKLILLTGCRKSEILSRTWRDVNLTRRELRLPDTKNDEPQTVALGDEACEVFRCLPRGLGDTPVFPMVTVKKAWNRVRARLWLAMNPEQAERLRAQAERDVAARKAHAKHASDRPAAVEAQLLALALEYAKDGDDRLTIHDLRRSVGSLMALHESPATIGKALRNPSAVAVYARIRDGDARRALEDHGRRISDIVKGDVA